jgi:chemotaxis protein methyltransferase CheR
VRCLVEFAEQNLAHDPVPRSATGQWDVIFCRNVFIYFDLPRVRQVIHKFIEVLAPGGALFLGHSEVFPDMADELEVVFWGDTFYYRRRVDPRVELVSPAGAPRDTVDAETRAFPPGMIERMKAEQGARAKARPRPTANPDLPTETFRRSAVPGSEDTTQRFSTSRPHPEQETVRLPPSGGRLPREQLVQARRRMQTGDLEGAARALRAASSQAPRWAAPRLLLAEVYRRRGEAGYAKRELEAAVECEPLAHRAHFLLGELHASLGEHARAEVALRRALYLEPEFLPARYVLARSLQAANQYTRACRELRSVLRSLRGLDPAKVRAMADDLPLPPGDLRSACEDAIDDMGGSTEDSGVWRLPPRS